MMRDTSALAVAVPRRLGRREGAHSQHPPAATGLLELGPRVARTRDMHTPAVDVLREPGREGGHRAASTPRLRPLYASRGGGEAT